MKKNIFLIFVIALAISFNSCRKNTAIVWAYCDKGHSPWEGPKHPSGVGRVFTDTQYDEASDDAYAHDTTAHGGVATAEIRTGYE